MALWFLLFCWAVIQPRHHWWTPWPMWVVIAGLAGFGLLAAVPITLLTQPVVNTYAAVLNGLTRPQRAAVARALRSEPVPVDPTVLTAAVRASDLAGAYRSRVTPARRRLGWVLIGIFAIALPVLEFLADRPQLALLYLALALVILALQAGPEWIRRRREPHLVRLRAAAAADPQVAAAVAQAVSPAVPTARERWLRVGLVVILAVGAGVAVGFLSHASGRDCRTATAAARYISDHEDLLDPRRIEPGGPDLAEYRAWSDRLQRYPSQVSTPDIARQLQRIADLSADAVSVVEHARTPAAANDTTGILLRSYLGVVQRLVNTDTQMLEDCTR
nr:hypothetical protein [Mycolicibacterium farcinogenes]